MGIGKCFIICHSSVTQIIQKAVMFSRYAVYFTPVPSSALAQFGARWLGWDSDAGQAPIGLTTPALDVPRITETPRKYGFHGTIKPPFRLASGTNAADLEEKLRAFCTSHTAVHLSGLKLQRLGHFLALVPDGPADDLAQLAAHVVQDFDDFRAEPDDAELAKRRARSLTPMQDAYLRRWGYPYVMDEFRFHMTLSGRLNQDDLEAAESALTPLLQDIPMSPFAIDALTLLGEADNGRFHQLQRFALAE
ncbi:MAG: DUF1045 domain-containing protein [Paracoccaceae bacterium]